jgi:hypothetical protein
MVPRATEPPTAPFTDQVTEVLEVPETLALNGKESPARTFALEGDTTTLTEGGGGDGCLVGEVEAAQPAIESARNTEVRCRTLRIFSGAPEERFERAVSLGHGAGGGYWTKGQKLADVLEKGHQRPDTSNVSCRQMCERPWQAARRRASDSLVHCFNLSGLQFAKRENSIYRCFRQ